MRKKGIALIVVLVIVVLFSALMLVVVLSATSAIRKAHYFDDKTTALMIAESGVEDVFYWMNYKGYDTQTYPLSNKYFLGSDCTTTETPWTNESNSSYKPLKGLTKPNYCRLEFIDSDDVDGDKIISTGFYNGKSAKVTVRVRGNNGNGNSVHSTGGRYLGDWDETHTETGVANWGISESFNKHTIYANTIAGNGSNIKAKGNFTYANYSFTGTFDTNSEATWTETRIQLPRLAEPPTIPTVSVSSDSWDKKFENGKCYDSTIDETKTLPYAGVTYTSETEEIYTIKSAKIYDEKWLFEAGSSTKLTVKIEDSTTTETNFTVLFSNGMIRAGSASGKDANIEITFSNTNTPSLEGKLVAAGNIEIKSEKSESGATPNTIGTSGTTLWAGNDINLECGIDRIVIKGDVYAENDITFNNSNGEITINGDVTGINRILFTGNGIYSVHSLSTTGNLEISGTPHVDIDASSSNNKAGILLCGDSDKTLKTAGTINIITGNNQVAGIMVYFPNLTGTKNSNITIGGSINFNDSEHNKFLLVNRSDKGKIDISSNVKGSIYSAFYNLSDITTGETTINVNSGTIKGSIITNGIVNLNGGSVIYNSDTYKRGKGDVYKGFKGGRRVYVPVPGSWRVEW